ncbi:MAG: hypothetical protein ACFFB5_09560 [Promethearchaeota archaeon]
MKTNENVIVIFGGSSGIGEALTIGLAEHGHIVVPVSHTRVKVDNVCQKLDEQHFSY